MKKVYPLLLFASILLCITGVYAQPSWHATTAPLVYDRYDDVYFLNPDTGWAVTLGEGAAYQWATIIKTTDGGITWQTMLDSGTAEYRDIAFLNAKTGFIGTLNNNITFHDTSILYQTHDGGASWGPVINLPGPAGVGICGMRVINDSTLYAVGRYFGPAGFYKTTDTGNTWTYTDMSAYASGLVDAYFFNADTGFVCGVIGYNTIRGEDMTYNDGQSGIILYTTNGGTTWQVNHITGRTGELCWKMSFPSRMIGYASIESFNPSPADSQYCLKTTDGGLTWHDVFVCQQPGTEGGFDEQGIGFINDSVGWLGGRNSEPGLAPVFTYKTLDGGASWNPDNFGEDINRFRFLSDTLCYFSGRTIYKYSKPETATSIKNTSCPLLVSVYPNPANTTLFISDEQADEVFIYDMDGRCIAEIKKPINNQLNISSISAGIYLIQIKSKDKTSIVKWEKY